MVEKNNVHHIKISKTVCIFRDRLLIEKFTQSVKLKF